MKLFSRDIKVYGVAISPDIISKIAERVIEQTPRAKTLTAYAVELGVPESTYIGDGKYCPFAIYYRPVAMRLVDRILQAMRKAGVIKFTDGRWVCTRTGDATSSGS